MPRETNKVFTRAQTGKAPVSLRHRTWEASWPSRTLMGQWSKTAKSGTFAFAASLLGRGRRPNGWLQGFGLVVLQPVGFGLLLSTF